MMWPQPQQCDGAACGRPVAIRWGQFEKPYCIACAERVLTIMRTVPEDPRQIASFAKLIARYYADQQARPTAWDRILAELQDEA